jgi:SAM-dependent methyltransferase
VQVAGGTAHYRRDLAMVHDRTDVLPAADAVVSVGHLLSYLPDQPAVERALAAVADALRPGGFVALDVCDRAWGAARREARGSARVEDDWAVVTVPSVASADRLVRRITTFVRTDDGSWRRDDEEHHDLLVDTRQIPPSLAAHGVDAVVGESFGGELLPEGLRTVVGRKRA